MMSMSVFAQDYYVWIDANGVTNYAQNKPQGFESRLVSSSQRPDGDRAIVDTNRGSRPGTQAFDEAARAGQEAQQAAAASAANSTNEEVDPDKVIEQDRAAVAAVIAEQKRANCDIGKKQLTTLEMFRRIRVKDEDGEDRVLSEKEKADRTVTARKIIRDNCTN
jgi:hypothetical protein